MTTIAWKDGVLAADSLVTDESCVMQICKIVRLPKGDVAGGAGTLPEVMQALWLTHPARGLTFQEAVFADDPKPQADREWVSVHRS